MVPIITFIGWHNSGKTTVASQVVRELKKNGLRVGVIKSTKDTGLVFDKSGTDTASYREAEADAVALSAPDQFVLFRKKMEMNLVTMAGNFFPDVDIVIGEGFKEESGVAKIEVLRDMKKVMGASITGIIATVSDLPVKKENVFSFSQTRQIAHFITKKFLPPGT